MSEHDGGEAARLSAADVKIWILGGIAGITLVLGAFVGAQFNSRIDRLEALASERGQKIAALEVRVGTSGTAVDGIAPRLDDMSKQLARLEAQMQGLRADLDRTERGSRGIGR